MSSQGLDRHARLAILSEAAADDREHGMPLPHHRRAAPGTGESPVGIRTVRIPGRGTTSLMRVMQTNACSLSCGYCPTFCGGRVKRTALAPEEVARTFIEAHRAGLVSGLFLTSGVPGRAVRAMDRMLDAVHILRRREGFTGYVHMKVLPGAQRDQVREASRLSDRVSVNLEGPRDDVVRRLAREKDFSGDLLPSLELAGRLSRDARLERRPDGPARMGTTTQFVVGAQGEQDREILSLVGRLEGQGLLHHAHFSAFQPVAGTPMEGLRPTPSARAPRRWACAVDSPSGNAPSGRTCKRSIRRRIQEKRRGDSDSGRACYYRQRRQRRAARAVPWRSYWRPELNGRGPETADSSCPCVCKVAAFCARIRPIWV